MTLPPLPPIDQLHELALDYRTAFNAANEYAALEHYVRTYAEQYGRLCAEAEREACLAVATEHVRMAMQMGAKEKARTALSISEELRARGNR